MEHIRSITIINNGHHAVHAKINWPEGDEAYVLEAGQQVRARLDDVQEDTEIKIEAGQGAVSCIYKAGGDDRTLKLTPAGEFEWSHGVQSSI